MDHHPSPPVPPARPVVARGRSRLVRADRPVHGARLGHGSGLAGHGAGPAHGTGPARGTLRLLVALVAMALVAALQMTAPAHGDPGDPSSPRDDGAGTVTSTQARWGWPMASPHRIIAPFVAPAHRYGPGHRGVDIQGSGTEVRAVEDGTVRFAGSVAGRGVVSILHADGLLSTYEPVTASVSAGDRVRVGQVIGELQEGGAGEDASHCAQACLHLGARRGGADYVDPEPLLRGAEPSVLLPLEGIGSALALLSQRTGRASAG